MSHESTANGLIKSPTDGQEIQPIFDYGELSVSNKQLLEEVMKLLDGKKGRHTHEAISEIKMKFNLAEVPMMAIENSLWHQFTKDEKLGVHIQGYREVTDAEGKKMRIPHVGFSADLDYLDQMISRIIMKSQQLTPISKE